MEGRVPPFCNLLASFPFAEAVSARVKKPFTLDTEQRDRSEDSLFRSPFDFQMLVV